MQKSKPKPLKNVDLSVLGFFSTFLCRTKEKAARKHCPDRYMTSFCKHYCWHVTMWQILAIRKEGCRGPLPSTKAFPLVDASRCSCQTLLSSGPSKVQGSTCQDNIVWHNDEIILFGTMMRCQILVYRRTCSLCVITKSYSKASFLLKSQLQLAIKLGSYVKCDRWDLS